MYLLPDVSSKMLWIKRNHQIRQCIFLVTPGTNRLQIFPQKCKESIRYHQNYQVVFGRSWYKSSPNVSSKMLRIKRDRQNCQVFISLSLWIFSQNFLKNATNKNISPKLSGPYLVAPGVNGLKRCSVLFQCITSDSQPRWRPWFIPSETRWRHQNRMHEQRQR